jgi:hypothetical protein
MKQVGARHDIIREWRLLPKELRQTEEQADAFAMQIKDEYKFSSDSADPYHTVRGWLLSYLSLTRGLGSNAKGIGEMGDVKKSTDPDLSAAERKTLRGREAKEAIADHEEAQKAFHGNRAPAGRTSSAGGRCGTDALSGARTSGRYAYPERPILYQDPESTKRRGYEDDRRDT